MAETISLAEELGNAMDAEGESNATDTIASDVAGDAALDAGAVVEQTAETDAATRARDERGRFARAAEGEAEPLVDAPVNGATEAAPVEVSAPQVDLPPSTWTPEAKAAYMTLSPVVKNEMKKREADFQRGISQYKELATHGDAFQRAVNPYMAMIHSEGGDPIRSVTNLLNTAHRLRSGTPQERGQMVMAIAQQFGADITPWMGQQQQQDASGQVNPAALQSYVQQLVAQQTAPLQQYQQSLLSQQQQQEQQAAAATSSQIAQFRNAVDSTGKPAHIYFDNVRELMASVIESGVVNTLDDAYKMACRAHPEVAKALDAEQRLAGDQQRLGEAKRKADEARRAAAANVSGQGGIGLADTSKTTLRDDLAAAFNGAASHV